jgi:hypothetical protein
MPFPISLSQQEYEALISLARDGTRNDDGSVDQTKALQLDAWLRQLEENSGITRDAVWVQWQESDQPLPPTTNFPDTWPPELRHYIELVTRPIARADVDAVIETQASMPVNILVTRDPAARTGWTALDDFFA